MSTTFEAALARIRGRCLSFPEVTERESHGCPTFFVREKRSFLNAVESYYGSGGRPAIVCAALEGVQAALVEAEPERYFLPKYVAKLGWIGMWIDRDPPWGEVDAIIAAAYESAAEKLAPKRRAPATKKSAKKKAPGARTRR